MRQDLGGHNTKVSASNFDKSDFLCILLFQYGLLIDDTKNILLNDYADMRDRQYDDARQVCCTKFETFASTKQFQSRENFNFTEFLKIMLINCTSLYRVKYG